MRHLGIVAICLLASTTSSGSETEVVLRLPRHHKLEVVAASDQPGGNYLAFPALLDLGDEVLVSYKRGRSHAYDPGAALDLVRISKEGKFSSPEPLAQRDDLIMQMGEWVRFPNGQIANYIDTQTTGKGTTRIGLHAVRSQDGGRTFGPLARVGLIDGVEYGYAFDAVVEGQTTWMLAMRFANLAGGKSIVPQRPHAGSVDVVRTDDNGQTWHFVRDLSHEFGDVPINESAFVRHGEGFLVTTRGYDNRQRVHLTDASFRVTRQLDLTGEHDFIGSYIGRPRLFARDGGVYLLGRNWTASPRVMQLALFRLDPSSLRVMSYSILDNAEKHAVSDGYYAMPYFRGDGDQTKLYLIDYKAIKGQRPQIIRHEYLWNELK